MTGKPRIVSRSEWGARHPLARVLLDVSELEGVAIHYSASFADADVSTLADGKRRVRGVQRFHIDDQGWSDIAYSFLVDVQGRVYVGRGWGVRTAAQTVGNSGYHAFCFLGADRDGRQDVTPKARAALAWLVREAQRRYPHATRVRPHSDFSSTSCPGDELRAWIARKGWKD